MLKSPIAAIAIFGFHLAVFSCRASAEPKKEDVQVLSIKYDKTEAKFILKTKDGDRTLTVGKDVILTSAQGKEQSFPKAGVFEEWPPVKIPPMTLAITLVTEGDRLVEIKLKDEGYVFSPTKSEGGIRIVQRKKK